MDITGILKVKEEAQQVSEKFRKREFVITDNSSQYPQHISFQLTQDKCGLIDNCAIGTEVKVHFNIRGRQWTSPKGEDKYFNTLEAWRLEFQNSGSNNNSSQQSNNNNASQASNDSFSGNSSTSEEDLPF